MKNKFSSIIVLLSLLSSACTKVINVDLNDKSGQYVIEGTITNQLQPYYVKISKSGAFSNETGFKTVNNALVIIADNLGTIDTLTLDSNGYYKTNKIIGTPGGTYKLKVEIGTRIFNSQSTMPSQVNFDTLVTFEDAGTQYLLAAYQDNATENNYYRFKTIINGKQSNMINVFDDKLDNGLHVTQLLYEKIKTGDTVNVNMMSVDYSTYNYFFNLAQITGMGESATPANPVSNITGGCLGYFSAHTLQQRTVIIH